MTQEQIQNLIQKALAMLPAAYAPYSNYRVGAALLAKDGRVFCGCNIENVAFGPSNCAERTAFFKAVSEGCREFEAIAVAGGPQGRTENFCSPCGVCRQVMREFCADDFQIVMAKSESEFKVMTLAQILPESFAPQNEVGASAKN